LQKRKKRKKKPQFLIILFATVSLFIRFNLAHVDLLFFFFPPQDQPVSSRCFHGGRTENRDWRRENDGKRQLKEMKERRLKE